jgi:hypothetical protein
MNEIVMFSELKKLTQHQEEFSLVSNVNGFKQPKSDISPISVNAGVVI